jgi:hypothetical protein
MTTNYIYALTPYPILKRVPNSEMGTLLHTTNYLRQISNKVLNN